MEWEDKVKEKAARGREILFGKDNPMTAELACAAEKASRAACAFWALDAAEPGETITVRRVSYGVGVEKVFPLHAPAVEKIEVVRKGKVRRAKLYYLRDRVGKSAKVKERI